MPLDVPTSLPPVGKQTNPDEARVAVVIGGQLASAPARGIGLTDDELAFIQGGGGGSGSGTAVFIGDAAPPAPGVADLWFESDSGDTFIRYNDGSSTQWVQINAGVASGGGGSSVEPGTVQMFARSTPPLGWLKANGAAISRAAYSLLFSSIGTTFGAGDGSTTFNLPDLRGEFIRFWDDARGVDAGRSFGSAQGQATITHTHTFSGTTSDRSAGHQHYSDFSTGYISADHAHAYDRDTSSGANNHQGGTSFARQPVSTASGGVNANHTHAVQGWAGGENVGHTHTYSGTTAAQPSAGTETRPRNVALLACIRY